MRKTCAVILLSLPLIASASNCDEISADIAAKIQNNGVPLTNFQLKLIPTDQASQQIEGKIVGSCDRGQQKIVYLRTDSVSATPSIKIEEVKIEEGQVETNSNDNSSSETKTKEPTIVVTEEEIAK